MAIENPRCTCIKLYKWMTTYIHIHIHIHIYIYTYGGGDPQVTMGFNTSSWSFMTWMIWDAQFVNGWLIAGEIIYCWGISQQTMLDDTEGTLW